MTPYPRKLGNDSFGSFKYITVHSRVVCWVQCVHCSVQLTSQNTLNWLIHSVIATVDFRRQTIISRHTYFVISILKFIGAAERGGRCQILASRDWKFCFMPLEQTTVSQYCKNQSSWGRKRITGIIVRFKVFVYMQRKISEIERRRGGGGRRGVGKKRDGNGREERKARRVKRQCNEKKCKRDKEFLL